MVWQQAGTVANSTGNEWEMWKEVFLTYLSTRTGFTAVPHPSDANTVQISYTAKNLITNTDITWWYAKLPSASFTDLNT